MADRPQKPEQFDWLYGQRGRQGQQRPSADAPATNPRGSKPTPKPEATQVMPVQQRAVPQRQVRERYQAPPSQPPQQPPAAPGATYGGWRPRLTAKVVRRGVLLLVLAWIAEPNRALRLA